MKKFINKAKLALTSPQVFIGRARNWGKRINRLFFSRATVDTVPVTERDWDNLIILDGCRYDMYSETQPFDSEPDKIRSVASSTRGFLHTTFPPEGEFHDIVYIMANPWAHIYESQETFHALYDLFSTFWDEEIGTVMPKAVTDEAIKAAERHPNKRLIIHYLQPHYPFVGESGSSINHKGVTGYSVGHSEERNDTARPIWVQLNHGIFSHSKEKVWEAYVENLEIVYPHLYTLLEELNGKSVITSDHGNMFGERMWPIPLPYYGHNPKVPHPTLLDVPWHIQPFESRRKIIEEEPNSTFSVNDGDIENHLESLGYL